PDVASWNAMIRGYAYNGPSARCLFLFDEMTLRCLEPNDFTYPYVFKACSNMGLFHVGEKMHSRVIKSGFLASFSVGNAIFDMYVQKAESSSSKGNWGLEEIRMVFHDIGEKSIESWNKMLGKYASSGDVKNARSLFDEMPQKDVVTWNTMISAYAKARDAANAEDLFRRMPEKKTVVTWTAMLGLYSGTGDVETARAFFDRMPHRNVVSWNCMMSIYNKNGAFRCAVDLLLEMLSENEVKPDSFTFVAALTACSNLNDLESGRWVHSLITDWNAMVVIVGTALFEMYANCGDIHRAFPVFIKIRQKDVFAYNVMIKSLAVHGRPTDAMQLFGLMQRGGLKPNDHSFSSALFACSHGGLVYEAQKIFNDMGKPKLEHYCLMVDLLCRNDQTGEAEDLVKAMNVEPDVAIWGALLQGCRDRGDVRLAEVVINKAMELKSDESGVHVLLSNIHASVGQWEDALRARSQMEDNGMVKRRGSSRV
ncbi:hypothetical protein M569_06159, partial [Genlisea aurea]